MIHSFYIFPISQKLHQITKTSHEAMSIVYIWSYFRSIISSSGAGWWLYFTQQNAFHHPGFSLNFSSLVSQNQNHKTFVENQRIKYELNLC